MAQVGRGIDCSSQGSSSGRVESQGIEGSPKDRGSRNRWASEASGGRTVEGSRDRGVGWAEWPGGRGVA